MEKAKEMASSVVETTRAAASAVAEKTSNIASAIGHKASQAASAMEDTWDSGSRYVQEKGLRGMADDLAGLIRQHPFPALAVGFTLGFLLAQATRR
jgi:hypothetical protein